MPSAISACSSKKRQTKKTYVARVAGQVAEPSGRIALPLIVDWPNRLIQKVDFETSKEAITEWRRLRMTETETRMRLMAKTGRSHQLRVQMKELGHPILGDPFYATGAVRDDYPCMMLHAKELRLRHPDGGRGMSLRAKAQF